MCKRVLSFVLLLVMSSFSLLCARQLQPDIRDTSDVEFIKVYFNMPSDHTVALPGNKSKDEWDIIGTLIDVIDNANASVDLAIYDLEHQRVADALARAVDRGVQVRIVTDDHNRDDSGEIDKKMWDKLAQSGIISIDDDGDIYQSDGSVLDNDLIGSSSDMHHKFAVIDAMTPSPEDDYVWTGSTNLTYTGAYNTNNTVVIKDSDIAEAYFKEFNQMWGDTDATPNAALSKYHKDKKQVSEIHYWVGNIPVEIYFGPVNRERSKPSISERLVKLINEEAQNDINFQAFAISPGIPISQAMWAKSASGEVDLNGLIDRAFYYRYKNNGDIWAVREAQVANRNILPARELRKLHHKVMIIDAYHPDEDDSGVAVTGSYNFSKNAELNNDENLVIIHSDLIANQFYQDFRGALNRASGKTAPPEPAVKTDILYQPYKIIDGRTFEIELAPGFGYPVEPLGVWIPTVYAGNDSSHYYAEQVSFYLENLLSDKSISIEGPYNSKPKNYDNSYHAYITVYQGGQKMSLNRKLLINGYGRASNFLAQHPDSVETYKHYEQIARENNRGMWKNEEMVGKRIPRKPESGQQIAVAANFPINLNTANAEQLQMLNGIGPAYSKRIIDYRNKHGRFKSIEELRSIKGIGPKTLEKLRPVVTVD